MVVHRWRGIAHWFPEIAATLTTTGFATTPIWAKKLDIEINDVPTEIILPMSAALWVGMHATLGYFCNAPYRFLKNAFGSASKGFSDEADMYAYQEAIKKDPEWSNMYLEMADIHLRQKNYDLALEYYKRGLKAKRKSTGSFGCALYDTLLDFPIKWFSRTVGKKQEPGLDQLLSYAISDTMKNHRRDAKRSWKKVFAQGMSREQQIELKVLYAMSLDALDEQEAASEIWKSITRQLLHDGTFQKVGESRNEVLVYEGSHFLQSVFRFKRRKIDGLEERVNTLHQEHDNLEQLRRKMPDHVAQSYGVIESANGHAYEVHMVSYEGTCLDDLVQLGDKKTVERLQNAISVLAEVHSEQGDRQEKPYFIDRAEQVGLRQILGKYGWETIIAKEEWNDFVEWYEQIGEELANAPHALYRDSNLKNYAVNSLGQVRAFDLEGRRFLPVQLDLVSLLEFGREYLTEEEKSGLIEQYILLYEEKTKEKIDRKTFQKQYESARVQRHLELAGYRARDAVAETEEAQRVENTRRMLYHLEQARTVASALFSEATPITTIVDKIYTKLKAA